MYNSEKSGWLKHIDFILLDMICMEFSFYLAYVVRHKRFIHISFSGGGQYQQLSLYLLAFHVLVMSVMGSYGGILRRSKLQELKAVIMHYTGILIVLLGYLFISRQSQDFSRSVVILFWLLSMCTSFPVRNIMKNAVISNNNTGESPRKILLVTKEAYLRETYETLLKNEYYGYSMLGAVVSDKKTGSSIDGIPILTEFDSLNEFVKEHVVDAVFIYIPDDNKLAESLINNFIVMGITVHNGLVKCPVQIENTVVENVGGFTVLTKSVHIASFSQTAIKRVMDICGALAGIVLTAILFIIIAPVIYIQSPGPVIFKQDRVGKNGRIFTLYKFRSMCMDAEAKKAELDKENQMQGPIFKNENDPRIIPIGHFIRKTSIDEFPQFFNVLKGDMSLVGTRPPTKDEYDKYEMHHLVRLSARPGLTGLWQVSGRSNITDFEEIVKLDAEYIQNWSIKLDIKIILMTIKGIIKGDGM